MCRFQRNRIYTTSVGAAIMSREVVPRVLFYLLAFFLVVFSKASSYVLPDDCLKFDIDELEDYLSKLHFENVPTINMMIGEFKCPVTALPFGALKSDWARLLLLQRAQPNEPLFLEKLARLFRILVIAYFRIEERYDGMVEFRNTSSLIPSSTHETTTSINSRKRTKKLNNSITDFRDSNETPTPFTSTVVLNNEESLDTMKTERTAFTNFTNNLTSEGKGGNSDTILDNVPLSTTPFSPVGSWTPFYSTSKQIDEKERVTAFRNVTVFPDISTEKQKYTETSTLERNELVATKTTKNFTNDHKGAENTLVKDRLSKDKHDLVTDKKNDSSLIAFSKSTESTLSNSLSINNFSITTVSVTADVSDYQKSISKSVEEEERTKSTGMEERGFNKTSGRGDFPIPYDYDVTDFNLGEYENVSSPKIFHVKTTTELSRIYSDKISDNGSMASSTESFNQSRSNHRRDDIFQDFEKIPWNSSNSTVPRNKIKKLPIYKKVPMGHEFWKYITFSQKVTSTTFTARPTFMSEAEGTEGNNSMKSKKRGSSNTNIEKNFRWFYNFGHEDEEYSSNDPVDRQGIHIECNEKKHNDQG